MIRGCLGVVRDIPNHFTKLYKAASPEEVEDFGDIPKRKRLGDKELFTLCALKVIGKITLSKCVVAMRAKKACDHVKGIF